MSAIIKYGWDNFTHEILFDGLTKKEACEKEVALILFHKSNDRKFGYNNSSGGEYPGNGWHPGEETRKKMSNAHKDRKFSEEHRNKIRESLMGKTPSSETRAKIGKANSIPIVQLSLTGEVIREWPSCAEASRQLGIHASNIGRSCRKEVKTAGGFTWKFIFDI
jgi:group I intron endonuclease